MVYFDKLSYLITNQSILLRGTEVELTLHILKIGKFIEK